MRGQCKPGPKLSDKRFRTVLHSVLNTLDIVPMTVQFDKGSLCGPQDQWMEY
jgi:hypothetical protein